MPRLFAVLLGGNCAPRSNTELHDVVFVAGERLEDTHEDLLAAWFGTPEGLHIDGWMALEEVDGHRVRLRKAAPPAGPRLWFVNLGGYRPGQLQEAHASTVVVAAGAAEARRRAREALLRDHVEVHTDDLHDVGRLLQVGQASGWHVWLEAMERTPDAPARSGAGATGRDEAAGPRVHIGYRPLPEQTIAAFAARQRGDRR